MAVSKGLLVAATALSGVSAFSIPQIPLEGPKLPSVPWSSSSDSSSSSASANDLPIIDSKSLQSHISADRLEAHAKEFFEIAKLSEHEYNHPTRVIGSDGHEGTLAYVKKKLAELGDYYEVSSQPFGAVSGNVFESRLVIGDQVSHDAAPMGLTPPTKNKQPVFGDLVLVENDGCNESDFPAGVEGNIAFILRGVCPFGTKSENAGKAGALAAIVYNYEDDVVHGTLGTPSPHHIATFGLGGKEGKPLAEKLKNGEKIDGIAYIDAEVKTISTNNIIAQTRDGDPDNCVMLGGHSDSVAEGPGINDDGSGSISILEVATHLTNYKVNNCVRFAWWAAEEEGLLGSDHYVEVLPEEENQKIRLFMDYDMMGSPNFAYQIYNATNAESPAGSEELRNLYINWYDEQGLPYTFIPFDGRSDYDGFIRGGIPAGGIATGAEGVKTKEEEEQFGGVAGKWYDPCYHQLCDDLSNVNYTAWVVNTKLIAHSVATYALSFEGFPERTKEELTVNSYDKQVKYHGDKLIL